MQLNRHGSLGEAARLQQPVVKVADAGAHVYTWTPAGRRFEAGEIRDVIPLVAGAPFLVENFRPAAVERGDEVEQLEQRDGVRGPAAHIEGLAGDRGDVRLGEKVGAD